jgi:hypothetical protein
MSSFGEQDCMSPDNPELEHTPLRLSERAAKLGPLVSQGARSEPFRPSPMLLPALLAPEATDEPARRTRDPNRRTELLSVATVVAGVTVAALLFVTMKPASRQSVASSTPSEITGSTSHSNQGGAEALAPEWTAPPTLPPSQPANDEQSQQLLQRFLQWREKAINTETSQ